MKLEILIVACAIQIQVRGHGRMLDPPQRSSMWRAGFNVSVNYNDHELFCGGMTTQWSLNGGRCGECGDAYHLKRPRENDEGGLYGTGEIGRSYTQGQVITTEIELTQSHKGNFQFKLCKKSSSGELTTQDCLDKNILPLADGSGSKYYVKDFKAAKHYPKIKLPKNLHCEHCVLQWHYTAGNNWGDCGNGTWAVGCGPQETFINCADIRITPNSIAANIKRSDFRNEILKLEDI